MSRLVQHEQYEAMLFLRNGISQAVAFGSEAETTQRSDACRAT